MPWSSKKYSEEEIKAKCAQASQKYRGTHPYKARAACAKWELNNKDKMAVINKRYYATLKCRKVRKVNSSRFIARKHGVLNTLTYDDITTLMENNPMACNYCGCDLSYREVNGMWQIDHVVSMSRGGSNTLDNIVICCKVCNRKKNNQPVEKFRAQL